MSVDRGAALAALYPDLVRLARRQLWARRLDAQVADDLVGDATVRWLSANVKVRSERQVRAWFRVTMTRIIIDRLRRPGRDLMDQREVWSLDEQWARGE